MATDKTAVKASTHKARQQGVMAFGHIGPTVGGTLESTVLAMLSSVACTRRRKAALVLLGMNSGRFACKLPGIPSAKRQAARSGPPNGCGAARLTALPGKGVTMQVLRGVRDSVLRSKPANLIRFMPA